MIAHLQLLFIVSCVNRDDRLQLCHSRQLLGTGRVKHGRGGRTWAKTSIRPERQSASRLETALYRVIAMSPSAATHASAM
eukprot:SAG25_NODE_11348_length_306_cov_1.222222_1_plen_79_part_10